MAGQITLLKNEIDADPLLRGYSTMSNIQVADSMNALDLSRNKTSVANTEALEAIDSTALLLLTGDAATRVWGILSIESFDPFGVAVEVFKDAFGQGSATIVALAALRVESISRANELGYPGQVKEGHVEMARAK